MKKNLSAAAVLLFSVVMYSQVGINSQDPKATLDVTAKTTDGSKPEGIIAPRLTGDQMKAADAQYGSDQKGAIVYAMAPVTAPSTKTAGITAEGYYFFDGSSWKKIGNSAAANSWALNGNAGTDPAVNFIGTTDSKDIVFKSGSDYIGYIDNSGQSNTSLGWNAGNHSPGNSGSGNTSVGYGAGYSLTSVASSNVFVGLTAGQNVQTGSTNTGLGTSALNALTSGNGNVAVGFNSGLNMTTGVDNTFVGQSSGDNITTGSSNIIIGKEQKAASASGSYQLNIGGAVFGTGLNGNAASPAGNIGIGTTSPASKLEVNGSVTNTSAYDAGNSMTIDFSKSNLAYTSASAGNFTLQNMKDGGTYTLSVRGTASGTSSFSATGLSFKYVNNNASITNTETLYTFVIMGSVGYVYCVRGL